jgi:hypothetical protein
MRITGAMLIGRSIFLISCALCCIAVAAQDIDPDEAEATKKLTKAMQNAQLLLSELSDAFDCDYAGYDVRPTRSIGGPAYLVVIEVNHETCDDMVNALNYEGAEHSLAFVSEKKMPVTKSLPSSEPDPLDELAQPQLDYTLIHEVDPAEDQ